MEPTTRAIEDLNVQRMAVLKQMLELEKLVGDLPVRDARSHGFDQFRIKILADANRMTQMVQLV